MSFKIELSELQKKAKERTVKTQNIEYDLETLVKKIDRKVIKLDPDYQRKHRWGDDASSKLIESLILNIPIPYVYISLDIDVDDEIDDDGQYRYSVIDGQQRLTAIYNFLKNQYPLVDLEVLDNLNGAYYKDLPPFLIRRLEERTLKCLRIDSTLDQQVKYDIFERLNTGALKLESQELRNAIYRGPFKDLIKELSMLPDFISTCGLSESKKKKMEDQELILRFFAINYNDGYNKYKKGFKEFLNTTMQEFNQLGDADLKKMKVTFIRTFTKIKESNIKFPFSKWKIEEDGSLKLSSKFNASVYDSVCHIFMKTNKKIKDDDLRNMFLSQDYFDACTGSVNDISKIKTRMEKAEEVA
ncbi:DUF262 domain-containing protein [Klebsiella michiganensis]|uniref:DUF262 domain-containing protein n=1 Tax=Klebsiella michiganensis TaxID=1134687 RepID=UPI0021C861D8|nr:DUF262 domain-containing protein [Klebsiella michiganensis]MEB6370373.1 DUF262 domain-containing protein [Klebsiella michiganensis]UXO77767.1 DUF262 domain-containing protein [Klebsiella michiganensis]